MVLNTSDSQFEMPARIGRRVLLGGRLCLDFCNTVDERNGSAPRDFLHDYNELVYFTVRAGGLTESTAANLLAAAESQPEQALSVYEEALRLRDVIYQIAQSIIQQEGISEEALAQFNEFLGTALANRQMAPDEGGFIYKWNEIAVLDAVLWPITQSAAELFVSGDPVRLRPCPGCGWLFYDKSSNGRRTWCDMRFCGNRAKASRFYERHKDS
jgi:predicted RNA-binding Zn ribbon-like protein